MGRTYPLPLLQPPIPCHSLPRSLSLLKQLCLPPLLCRHPLRRHPLRDCAPDGQCPAQRLSRYCPPHCRPPRGPFPLPSHHFVPCVAACRGRHYSHGAAPGAVSQRCDGGGGGRGGSSLARPRSARTLLGAALANTAVASPHSSPRGAAAAARSGGTTRAACPAQGLALALGGAAAVGAVAPRPGLAPPGLLLTRQRWIRR